ncbi:hypothetical protein BCR43DRAFT_493464 [Syncephalastrum racemosum]|uniref:Uncharacterized protein n=1 Tax=Syncephalastrum racemosum TaxID=13706 RepID=A0A1X2HAN6_SYNRA|nr:hypothetical protein BCR43DRAFT_493464 [Syncephalastrum racemosum]
MPPTKGVKSDNPKGGIKQGTHHGLWPQAAAADDDSENLTDSQSAPTLPVTRHDNDNARSCRSEGDKSHDHTIDYQSLTEALAQSDNASPNDLDYDTNLNSSSSEFDDEMPESIELTHEVGSETLMEMLGGDRDLEQQMKAIEEQESTTTFDEPLTPPALIRVVYMGTTSDTDRRLFFQKLSEGLSRILDKDPLAEQASGMFRERKHHLLYLKRESDERQHMTCQDYGVSIIEADFSRRRGEHTDHPLFMRYIWQQCESAREDHPGLWKDLTSQHDDDYFCYPEKTPNGIDLCVYFYDGDNAQDLSVLQCFKKLGVPILPILSMYTGPVAPTLGVIADRRNQLADWLARYRIRCLDISLLSFLEFGQRPSFGLQKTPFPLASVASLSASSRRARGEWETAGMTTPAPYQILTIDQFVAMDRHAIFSILERSRQRAIQREALRDQIRKEMEKNTHESKQSAGGGAAPSPACSSASSASASFRKAYLWLPAWMVSPWFTLPLALLSLLLPLQLYCSPTYDASLTAATIPNTKNVSFTVELYDGRGHPRWYPHDPFVVLVDEAPRNLSIVRLDAMGTYQFTLPAPPCSPTAADPPTFMKVDLRSPDRRAALRTKPVLIHVPPCSSRSAHDSQPTQESQSWMGVVRCIYENSGEIARFMWNGDDITSS